MKINVRWTAAMYLLTGTGIFLRVFHFFHNRSFWIDEIYISTSLVKMSFIQLATSPLDYQQKAPIGYLWFTKLSTVLFGTGEMALRLFPLLCGILSMLVFISVSKYFLKPVGIVAAIGILALSPHLIYHSVEAKQYSTEVLCTILIIYLYTRYHKKTDIKSLTLWGIWGSIILWFSFSSAFVLGGMAIGISIFHLIKKDMKSFFINLIPFLLWLFSFSLNYFLFTYKYTQSEWLILWFNYRGGFMPPSFIDSISWLIKRPLSLMDFPLGLSWFSLPDRHYSNNLLLTLARMVVIPLTLLILGLVYSIKNQLKTSLILITPFILHLVTTFLFIYPFFERLTIYLAPLLILLIAFGCEKSYHYFLAFRSFIKSFLKKQAPYSRELRKKNNATDELLVEKRRADSYQKWSILIVFLLLAGPFTNSVSELIYTEKFGRHKHWHQREIYTYLKNNFEQGDAVYVYWNALVPYKYYNNIFQLSAIEGKDYRFSSHDLNNYLSKIKSDIKNLHSYKRVWVVYANYLEIKIGDLDNQPAWYYKDADQHLVKKSAIFNSIGKQIDHYKTKENINLYLFQTDKLRMQSKRIN